MMMHPKDADPGYESKSAELELRVVDGEVLETEDFDAFWSEQDRKGTTLKNVFGIDVQLPPKLPLRFEIEARRLKNSEDEDDIKRLVALLFGETSLDRWVDAGMDNEQFGVMIMWGTANASGQRMSLAEARSEYREMNAKKDGKDAGKLRKSRTGGGSSSSSGRSSRRTSRANTA